MSPHRAFRQVAFGIALLSAALAGDALAGRNDLKLVNLCPQVEVTALGVYECSWVQRDPATHLVTGVTIDDAGRRNFRSLMSELGVVMAPRIPMPAGTLGFAGFQVSGELGLTQISSGQPFAGRTARRGIEIRKRWLRRRPSAASAPAHWSMSAISRR